MVELVKKDVGNGQSFKLAASCRSQRYSNTINIIYF